MNATFVVAQANQYDFDNFGAHSEEVSEGQDEFCDEDNANMDRTVYFAFTAPAPGAATFSTGGNDLDTVMQVFRGNEGTPIRCSDDGATGLSSAVSVTVDQNQTYIVQIGGYFGPLPQVRPLEGEFTLTVTFVEDFDLDNDGVNGRGGGATDCNDGNPNVRPGLPSIVNNNVDENCDGVLEFDRDGDGARTPGGDCNDGNPNIRPGAASVRGNEVDENCDGSDPGFLSPTSAALLQGNTVRNGFRAKRLRVTQVPRRSRVRVTTCRRRGRCRTRTRRASAPEAVSAVNRTFSRLGRFRRGGSIVVRVTNRDFLTQVTRYRIRSRFRAPRRTVRCINPFRNRRTRCD